MFAVDQQTHETSYFTLGYKPSSRSPNCHQHSISHHAAIVAKLN